MQSETFNLEISGQRLVNRMLKNKKQQHKLPPEPNHRACSLAALHLRRYQGMAAILDSNHREFHSQTHTHTHTLQPSICAAERDRQEEKSNTPSGCRQKLLVSCSLTPEADSTVFFWTSVLIIPDSTCFHPAVTET